MTMEAIKVKCLDEFVKAVDISIIYNMFFGDARLEKIPVVRKNLS